MANYLPRFKLREGAVGDLSYHSEYRKIVLDLTFRNSDNAAMSPKQVTEHFGGIPQTATALGVGLSTIYDWIKDGEVPEGRQYQIELATNGALRAGKPALRSVAA